MKMMHIAATLTVLLALNCNGQISKDQGEIAVRGDGIISNHEMLKPLPPDFRDRMKIDLRVEEDSKIANEIKGKISSEYDKYILKLDDITLNACKERGEAITTLTSKRLGEIYNIRNAFYCPEARISFKYYVFQDNDKARMGGNELFNGWSAPINEHEVNRNIQGHRYGDFLVIPGDEGYVDDNPSIHFIYDKFYIHIEISGQGPEKLKLLDSVALKAIDKIKIGAGEMQPGK